ncbi:type 4a pilus biogenesis protein PilO [Pseudomonas rubra]|uniref:Type 4a pilus biogenesis protein PilO n=1 Tax=Pseudomonas rubra TaxID=2942627 RepID=A0ABT5P313_9PSED|nr:type 4a pilus biogenesis protein PilO [Pseudomonas rubra]MDD1012675.1 type 4a pilus biogenesis protein PilO [Pseudomonas rubra]MDD1037762.1 type 4a pilus biogenesis protein PilO [Pseudomonas rubra]MDD1157784.1 type 4a pilus biogenesis protein PilO [Pseudomonas rubra]
MRVPSLIVHERARKLGVVGLAGAGLLALALLYGAVVLLGQWQQVQALEQQRDQARAQVVQLQQGTLKLPQVPRHELEDFHRQLPAQPQATVAIDRIYALAKAEQITLARGEYALGIDPKTQLARYQILLPVRGSYPQIRRYVHALLGQLPALVLEDIDLQRKKIGDRELTGRIRMTLYLSRS